jgi:metallo-beta-lactamase class B
MRTALVLTSMLASCGGPAAAPSATTPAAATSASLNDPARATESAPIEPFRIVGNLYYIGAKDISSFLFATPAGLIVIDTGSPEMVPVVASSIEKLGFHVRDVKIVLSGHAHWDHVGGHAALQRASGAQVMAIGDDAAAIEQGKDLSPSQSDGWAPVHVDRVLKDGDTVELGGTKLQAVWAPGHTPGCTVWTGDVSEDGKPYRIAFFSCMEPSGAVKLVGNARFPDLVEQTRATFRKLRRLHPDFALLVHPDEQFAGKLVQIRAGTRPSPLYDPRAWGGFLDESEAELNKRVEAETRAAGTAHR